MEQIVKAAGPAETQYRDVSEDARGAGMERTAWIRRGDSYRGDWIATRFWAGQSDTEVFTLRIQAERWIEGTLDEGTLIARINVR